MSYTPGESQAGKPKSAIFVAALFLAATLGMAALVVESRGLGSRVRPDRWPVSLQPPRGWSVGMSERDDRTSTVVFFDDPQDKKSRRLSVLHLLDSENLTARQVCAGLASRPMETDVVVQVGPAAPCPVFLIEPPSFFGIVRSNAGGALMTAGVVRRQGAFNDVIVLELRLPGQTGLADVRLLQAVAASVRLEK